MTSVGYSLELVSIFGVAAATAHSKALPRFLTAETFGTAEFFRTAETHPAKTYIADTRRVIPVRLPQIG
jgi:hypothetical protein